MYSRYMYVHNYKSAKCFIISICWVCYIQGILHMKHEWNVWSLFHYMVLLNYMYLIIGVVKHTCIWSLVLLNYLYLNIGVVDHLYLIIGVAKLSVSDHWCCWTICIWSLVLLNYLYLNIGNWCCWLSVSDHLVLYNYLYLIVNIVEAHVSDHWCYWTICIWTLVLLTICIWSLVLLNYLYPITWCCMINLYLIVNIVEVHVSDHWFCWTIPVSEHWCC